MYFNKNLFLVNDNNMHPYVSRGDVAVYEPMEMNIRTRFSVYIVKYNGKEMVARVQFLIKGGMNLILDGAKTKILKFEEHEQGRVVFIGHVTGRVKKDGEVIEGYSLYNIP